MENLGRRSLPAGGGDGPALYLMSEAPAGGLPGDAAGG
jgi:hypothetical protein